MAERGIIYRDFHNIPLLRSGKVAVCRYIKLHMEEMSFEMQCYEGLLHVSFTLRSRYLLLAWKICSGGVYQSMI